jgi:hypothetical protein
MNAKNTQTKAAEGKREETRAKMRNAIDEATIASLRMFEDDLDRALKNLSAELRGILPDRYITLVDTDDSDCFVHIDGKRIRGLIVDDARQDLDRVFIDLQWQLQRRLRELRSAFTTVLRQVSA